MSDRAFLDFYDTLTTVPVNQHGAGSNKHFAQRTALYRMLGLTPVAIKNSLLLEIGPGSGDNALHLASWQPKQYHFIDGAKASVSAVQAKIDQGLYGENSLITYQDLSLETINGTYDFIICEGLIPGQKNPRKFLNNVLSAVNPGGACVFTTVSALSYLAEICRRILLPIIAKHSINDADLLAKLVTLFTPSLESLPSMSRKHEDWILDNIVHDWTERGLFSIEQALESLPENFSVLGCSPSFMQDWRWYKNSAGNNIEVMQKSQARFSSYLLDYRVDPSHAFSDETYQTLSILCEQAMSLHDNYRVNENPLCLAEFIVVIEKVGIHIRDVMPETEQSILDFKRGLEQLTAGNLKADFASFHEWFGRGQQYLSVVKDFS